MNLFHIAHLLSTAWAAAGELLTAGAILWALNALATAVRFTYAAGFAIGTFYRAHLHRPLKWAAVRLVALLITLAEYAWRAARWVWAHREQIREQIGQAFAYRYQPTSEIKLLRLLRRRSIRCRWWLKSWNSSPAVS